MENLLIVMAVGCLLALASAGMYLAARWVELGSSTSVWSFAVQLMRLAGTMLAVAAMLALLNVNVLALVLVFSVWLIDIMSRRQLDREALVWILALTMARKLPLAPSVSAYALECRGGYRWRVLRFAQRLQAGQTLSAALAQDQGVIGGLLTPDGAAAVCVGTACGDLPSALREAARVSNQRRPFWQEIGTRSVYLAQLVAVTLGVTFGFMYFIMPAFIKIFDDFGVKLPKATQWLVDASEVSPAILLLIALALFTLTPLALLLFGFLQFDLPGIGRWLRRRHTPALLRALAGVVERGQPLPTALDALAKGYPVLAIRTRLKKVAVSFSYGALGWLPWAEQGIINKAEAAVLDAAERVGNLAWALRTLADSQERRRGYRLQVAVQFFWPFAILSIGLVVGFIVIAGFLPLVELVSRGENL